MASEGTPNNAALLWPYVLPFLAYVGVASIPESWGVGREANYALRIVATGAALAWSWRQTAPLRGPHPPAGSVAVGLAAGLLGTVLWVILKAPFYESGGEAWSTTAFWLRVAASGTLVPVFEELLFRGYVLGLVVQWDRARRAGSRVPFAVAFERESVNELGPGAWTPWAVVISTILFASGHQTGEWPAALAYGLLMAALWIGRRDLLSCVVAHATTNVALGLWVRQTGNWTLW